MIIIIITIFIYDILRSLIGSPNRLFSQQLRCLLRTVCPLAAVTTALRMLGSILYLLLLFLLFRF